MTVPGAHEVVHQFIPLSEVEWKSFHFSHQNYRGIVADHRYEVLYGFADPKTNEHSIFLRADEVYGEELHSMKRDEWVSIGAWGPEEGPAKSVFLRLTAPQ